MSHLWSTWRRDRSRIHICFPLFGWIKQNAGISSSSISYSSFSTQTFPWYLPLCLFHMSTWIWGKCRISGKMLISFECAISVWSSLQFATVVGIVFSLLPLRLSSSKCSSLLSLLKGKQKSTASYGQKLAPEPTGKVSIDIALYEIHFSFIDRRPKVLRDALIRAWGPQAWQTLHP